MHIYISIHLPSFYIYIVLDLAIKLIWCTVMQGLYARLTGGVHLLPIYIYIYIYIYQQYSCISRPV